MDLRKELSPINEMMEEPLPGLLELFASINDQVAQRLKDLDYTLKNLHFKIGDTKEIGEPKNENTPKDKDEKTTLRDEIQIYNNLLSVLDNQLDHLNYINDKL